MPESLMKTNDFDVSELTSKSLIKPVENEHFAVRVFGKRGRRPGCPLSVSAGHRSQLATKSQNTHHQAKACRGALWAEREVHADPVN